MPKLCQLIAVANGKKSHAQSELTRVHHMLQKKELLTGISRTYRPKDEEGERLPPEQKEVQYTVNRAIGEARSVWSELFDAVAAQDNTNCIARASVVVDGRVILKDVPVTHLLFLEKQLIDLHTFVDKLPTLDPAQRWELDAAVASYRSEEQETVRTKKVPKNHVLAEATKEHPAQVQVFTEDVLVGYWSKTDFSGAIPAAQKNEMLANVRKLQEAVKFAREEANSVEVSDLKTGSQVLGFIFGTNGAS